MRIEFLVKVKIGKNIFEKGDVSSALDDDKCAICVNAGWAKDLDTGHVGELKQGAFKLEVNDLKQVIEA